MFLLTNCGADEFDCMERHSITQLKNKSNSQDGYGHGCYYQKTISVCEILINYLFFSIISQTTFFYIFKIILLPKINRFIE